MNEAFTFQDRGERMKPLLVIEQVAKGLEFGTGNISGDVDPTLKNEVHNLVTSQDILVRVDKYDDGCGDGRGVSKIFQSGKEIDAPNLNRPKVFGGSLTMAVATRIGLGKANNANDPVEEFAQTV